MQYACTNLCLPSKASKYYLSPDLYICQTCFPSHEIVKFKKILISVEIVSHPPDYKVARRISDYVHRSPQEVNKSRLLATRSELTVQRTHSEKTEKDLRINVHLLEYSFHGKMLQPFTWTSTIWTAKQGWEGWSRVLFSDACHDDHIWSRIRTIHSEGISAHIGLWTRIISIFALNGLFWGGCGFQEGC